MRAKGPRSWGRTSRFVHPLSAHPRPDAAGDQNTRHGSPDLRVRPLRAHPRHTVRGSAHDFQHSGLLHFSLSLPTSSRAGPRSHHAMASPPHGKTVEAPDSKNAPHTTFGLIVRAVSHPSTFVDTSSPHTPPLPPDHGVGRPQPAGTSSLPTRATELGHHPTVPRTRRWTQTSSRPNTRLFASAVTKGSAPGEINSRRTRPSRNIASAALRTSSQSHLPKTGPVRHARCGPTPQSPKPPA